MLTKLISELLASAVDALRANDRIRRAIVISTTLVFAALCVLYFGREFWVYPVSVAARDIGGPALLLSSIILLVALSSYTRYQFATRELDQELDSLREARSKIRKRLADSPRSSTKPDETVLDTIQLSLNQITEYYAINKSQARSSFRFSVFAMVAGLATIIAAVWFGLFRDTPDKQLGFITGVSGLLIQFISGAYFWMHQKSLSQLNYFYDKLVKMQDTMLAIQLSESLPEEQKHETKKQLISQLISRSSTSTDPAIFGADIKAQVSKVVTSSG